MNDKEKKAFKKAFDIKPGEKDPDKVMAALTRGLAELKKWVDKIDQLQGPDRAQALQDYAALTRDTTVARGAFPTSKKLVAKQVGEVFLPQISTMIETYRVSAKATPIRQQVGNRNVAVFWTDIPGYDDLTPADAQAVAQAIGLKVANGLDLYDQINANPPPVPPVTAADTKEVADLVWALKSKAQEKQGPYIKGALTAPNGEKLRKFLDGCDELYPRRSSHLPEQQGQQGQSARGIDYYGAMERVQADPTDVDAMLPSGMNTLLYQQVTSPSGQTLLYVKMETEGCFGHEGGDSRGDQTMTGKKRDERPDDAGHSWEHGKNYVKSKFHKEVVDKDIQSTREQTPKPLIKLCDKIVAAVTDKPAKAALKAACGKDYRLNRFIAALDAVRGTPAVTMNPKANNAIVAFNVAFLATFGSAPDYQDPTRFGGEVVLDAGDI